MTTQHEPPQPADAQLNTTETQPSRSVLYLHDTDDITIDETSIINSDVGEDWGLVAPGKTHVRIAFAKSDETVTIPRPTYNRLRLENPDLAAEIVVDNAAQTILDVGEQAVLDMQTGAPLLETELNRLTELAAARYVLAVECGTQEWPDTPTFTATHAGVPSIIVRAVRYPDSDAGVARKCQCQYDWDDTREALVGPRGAPFDGELVATLEFVVANCGTFETFDAARAAAADAGGRDTVPIEHTATADITWGLVS